MKPNLLLAFQSKQLKTSLQQFWGRGRFIILLGILSIFMMASTLIKTIDFLSWLPTENHIQSGNNLVVDPNPEKIKPLTDNPVRSIKIYPNPVTNHLTLSFDKTLENATVRVYDQNAKSIFLSEDQDGKTLDLDISEFPKGNYLINVEDNHYNYYSSKFIRK